MASRTSISQATSTYQMTPEQRVEWEAEVRSLYHDGMVRIVVTPTWAKLIDFEETLPSAVEELVRQREERQRARDVENPLDGSVPALNTATMAVDPRRT